MGSALKSIAWLTAATAAMLVQVGIGVIQHRAPAWAAAALLHPARRAVVGVPPIPFETVALTVNGLTLRGWRFPAAGTPRGTIVYLHGIADNRASAIGVAQRFGPLGYDVLAYDSRAHGASDGSVCTYGYYEKHDLRAVLASVSARPIVTIGTSLGAAIALQAAAEEPRIDAVVAAESFSDLRTIASERKPFFLTGDVVRRAFREAETRGKFSVDEVSPVAAAARITAPVLLIHGRRDRETPPAHSQWIYDALRGPKQLILVSDAGHNRSMTDQVWREVQSWIQNLPHGSAAQSVRRSLPDRRPRDPDQRVVGARDEHEQPAGARGRSRT